MSRDIKITSSKLQLKDFIESNIWKDLRRELKIWSRLARDEYDTVSDLVQLGKVQGRREAVGYLLELPNIFIQEIIEKEIENGRNTD
jgi:hypothetical protein